ASYGENRARVVRSRDRSSLVRVRTSGERSGRIQINGAIEVGPVLVHVVGPEEEPSEELPFRAHRDDLAARVDQLVRIVRQQIEIQSESRKLLAIKIAQAGADRDVASRQLVSRNRSWIDVNRQ